MRIIADFSTQALRAKRSGSEVLQALKDNSFQPRCVYPANFSFKSNGEVSISMTKSTARISWPSN